MASQLTGRPTNYDESKVGTISLPDPLVTRAGKRVATPEDWKTVRRAELLELFQTQMYGRSPGRPNDLNFEVKSTHAAALEGLATRMEVSIHLSSERRWPGIDALLYIPNETPRPPPVFAGLSFGGNHAVTTGPESRRWPIGTIVKSGYALVTAHCADLEPDHAERWKDGVRGVLGDFMSTPAEAPHAWGAIGAWAWGLSRIMDLLETLPQIDASRVAVWGHSRLGKAALWAGAQDERFALVVSNNSGKGGAAIMRRNFGETVERLNTSFPHWFCGNFKRYDHDEASLPIDAHLLIALMAPRPVYIASAAEDLWADPKGEFLSGVRADPVYRLFGKVGTHATELPPVDQPAGDFIGYRMRAGNHDVTHADWAAFIAFADRHLGDAFGRRSAEQGPPRG